MIDITHEELIPLLDAGKMLHASEATVRRWARSGRLATVKAGAKVLTSREAITRFLQPGPAESPSPHAARGRYRRAAAGDIGGRQEEVAGVVEDLRQRLGGF